MKDNNTLGSKPLFLSVYNCLTVKEKGIPKLFYSKSQLNLFLLASAAWSSPPCNISSTTHRLRVVPHFSSGIVERAKREGAWKSSHARKCDTRWGERKMRDPHFSLPAACRLFSRGVIFTRPRVSLALLSLRKNGGLFVVYVGPVLLWYISAFWQCKCCKQKR